VRSFHTVNLETFLLESKWGGLPCGPAGFVDPVKGTLQRDLIAFVDRQKTVVEAGSPSVGWVTLGLGRAWVFDIGGSEAALQ